MSEWARINATMFEHPKIRRAGRDARDVYVAAILYSVRVDSDGFVPSEIIATLDPELSQQKNRVGVEKLVSLGLLESTERGGYVLPSFEDYQRTRDDVEKQRAEWRERQQRSRKKRNPGDLVTRDCHANVTRESRDNRQTGPTDRNKTLAGAPRQDEVWDTLEELFVPVAEKTSAHGARNKACADLRRHGATPELLHLAFKQWPRLFPEATLTDVALAKHYAQLIGTAKPKPKGPPPCPECGVGGQQHTTDCSLANTRGGETNDPGGIESLLRDAA
jgi:hypothetical protein